MSNGNRIFPRVDRFLCITAIGMWRYRPRVVTITLLVLALFSGLLIILFDVFVTGGRVVDIVIVKVVVYLSIVLQGCYTLDAREESITYIA